MDRSNISTRRMFYTCNCGWIDVGHANPRSDQPHVGADSLWRQMCEEKIPATRDAHPWIPVLGDNNRFRFPNGREGFLVTYRQQMQQVLFRDPAVYRKRSEFVSTGKEEHTYVVSRGLNQEQKKSVALAIFQRVSLGFETLQAEPPAKWSTNSGYSVEDLVSNLIGFYRAVGDPFIERGEVPPMICGPCLGLEDNYRIFDRKYQNPADAANHGKDWSQIKNYAFSPKLPSYVDDACRGKLCKFPALLQVIRPARYGELFRAWELPYKHGYDVRARPVAGTT